MKNTKGINLKAIGFICWALVRTDEESEADPISEETWDPNRSND